MTTRTYYLPRNRFSIHLLNKIVEKIGCSIGDIKVSNQTDCIKVPLTCNDKDVKQIEKILYRYNMIGE
jgi:hypothetical protein